MLFKKKSYSIILRAISVFLIHAFLLSNVAFAIPDLNRDTLSPPSRFWEEETVRSVRAGEPPGKAFINRAVFRDISHVIAKYFGVSHHTLIPKIKEHIDAAELKLLKTHPHLDPLLAGAEIDELTYSEKENAYYLPIYRGRGEAKVKAFNYKF